MEINKVYNEDCLETMAKMPDNFLDCVITDPPYFLPVNSYVGKRGEGYQRRTLADTSILKGYFERIFIEIDRVLKQDGTLYVFCDGQSYPIIYQAMFPIVKYVRPLIWDKKVSYNGYTWRHQHEIIAWGERFDALRVATGDGDIIRCSGVKQKDRLHPAQKPIEVFETLIAKHQHYSLFYDPYGGSGTLAKACKNMGKNWICSELEKEFFKIGNNSILEHKPQPKLL